MAFEENTMSEGYSRPMMEDMSRHKDETHHKEAMTMEDIKDAFKKDFADEVHDANKYCDMAMVAEEKSDNEMFVKGLYEMAHDEYTHAKFIHDMLVDWGYQIPEKEMIEWHELKERIHRKFRK